jgi:hypothetical protein
VDDAGDDSQMRSCSGEPPCGDQDLGRGEDAHYDSMLILAHAQTSVGCDGARQVEDATVATISEVKAKTRTGRAAVRRRADHSWRAGRSELLFDSIILYRTATTPGMRPFSVAFRLSCTTTAPTAWGRPGPSSR